MLWHGRAGQHDALILDLLGPDLDALFDYCGRQFSLKTVVQIGDQLIERLRSIHEAGYIYRDVKPQNFLVGFTPNDRDMVYVLDFGLSKAISAIDPKKRGSGLVGTARYASINAHRGEPASYRDDLEALGYMLVYFCRGKLPWSGLKARNSKEKYEKIWRKKMSVPLMELCKGYPEQLATFIKYCRGLKFGEKPDYLHLKRLLVQVCVREGFHYDGEFDWMLPRGKPFPHTDLKPKAAAVKNNNGTGKSAAMGSSQRLISDTNHDLNDANTVRTPGTKGRKKICSARCSCVISWPASSNRQSVSET